mmetsp:Transcript_26034/g.48531  ORF Transcript_26034/g.48531 Transcript_26034/m.48531 type:complete len:306 (-) Transcript_26034:256-1173(-)|eukprot:CAMPEP_0170176392 /NCGR_PEP_ID=MMETSP0040_2-20121228/9274_1 /TAXON_ID=641309 /ORGANISM="Lotharella oceanica, Strain CCMP622" /LENGTH=305 /DNA_ID=CAMNT_0010418693 /DNA_START=1414 /DNA_END=2331 /DNA_ORIENTATION=-
MPFTPPLFKNIGKGIKDLLTKKFDDEKERGKLFTGEVLKFKTKSEDGVTIESYTKYKKGTFFSEITASGSLPKKSSFKLLLNSNRDVELSAKSKGLYKGLAAEIAAKASTKAHKGVLDLQYSQDFFAAQGKFTQTFDKSVLEGEISATIGEDNLSVGAMVPVKFCTKTFAPKVPKGVDEAFSLENFNLGVQMDLKDLSCNLLVKPKGAVELGFVQDVSKCTKLGGKFSVPAEGAKGSPTVSLAMSKKIDDVALHGAFDTTGNLKGTISKKYANPKLTASLTFGMDLTKGSDLIQPVGLAIALGDA